jgi:hypothetical protein
MPLAAALIATAASCLLAYLSGAPVQAYNGYAICLAILPMSFVWSYISLPVGMLLAFLVRIVVGRSHL